MTSGNNAKITVGEQELVVRKLRAVSEKSFTENRTTEPRDFGQI